MLEYESVLKRPEHLAAGGRDVQRSGAFPDALALRVSESPFAYDLPHVAEEGHVPMNQFFVTAIAEKVSALKTKAYFKGRQARGELSAVSHQDCRLSPFGRSGADSWH
jgi:hypothetical protein